MEVVMHTVFLAAASLLCITASVYLALSAVQLRSACRPLVAPLVSAESGPLTFAPDDPLATLDGIDGTDDPGLASVRRALRESEPSPPPPEPDEEAEGYQSIEAYLQESGLAQ